jgi:hypothetical protein
VKDGRARKAQDAAEILEKHWPQIRLRRRSVKGQQKLGQPF